MSLPIGKQLGRGSFSEAYVHADDPNLVVRVTRISETPEAVQLDAFGRKVLEDIADEQDAIRIVERHKRYVVAPSPGGKYASVEIVERADHIAKSLFAENAGRVMTPGQAEAFDRATRELNNRGYAWLDNKADNYGFEKLPGEDRWTVVVVDSGGIVPVKASLGRTAPQNAHALQRRINAPPADTVSRFSKFENPKVRNVLASEMKKEILDAFGHLIDFKHKELGLESLDKVQFNPSGVVRYPKAHELFGLSEADAARQADVWRAEARTAAEGTTRLPSPDLPGSSFDAGATHSLGSAPTEATSGFRSAPTEPTSGFQSAPTEPLTNPSAPVPSVPGAGVNPIAGTMDDLDRAFGVTPRPGPAPRRDARPLEGPVRGHGPRPEPGPDRMGEINRIPLDSPAGGVDAPPRGAGAGRNPIAGTMDDLDRAFGVTPRPGPAPRRDARPLEGPVRGHGPRPEPGPDRMGEINRIPLDSPAGGVDAPPTRARRRTFSPDASAPSSNRDFGPLDNRLSGRPISRKPTSSKPTSPPAPR